MIGSIIEGFEDMMPSFDSITGGERTSISLSPSYQRVNPTNMTRMESMGWHCHSYSYFQPNKGYHTLEWGLLMALAIIWVWQWEKRRRIKVLHKLSLIDPTITNENARQKVAKIRTFTERINFHRSNRGNTWKFLLSAPFIFAHVIVGILIASFAYSATPLGLFLGFLLIGIAVFARWVFGLF